MTATTETIQAAFENFSKWETYGTCYKALQNKEITLKEIQDIAWAICEIKPGVIAMRMGDFDQWHAEDMEAGRNAV